AALGLQTRPARAAGFHGFQTSNPGFGARQYYRREETWARRPATAESRAGNALTLPHRQQTSRRILPEDGCKRGSSAWDRQENLRGRHPIRAWPAVPATDQGWLHGRQDAPAGAG